MVLSFCVYEDAFSGGEHSSDVYNVQTAGAGDQSLPSRVEATEKENKELRKGVMFYVVITCNQIYYALGIVPEIIAITNIVQLN